MMVTATGTMSLQLAALKEMIELTTEWPSWAGAEFQDRIFFNSNMREIEGGGFFYPAQDMPFIVIWTPGANLVYHSQACFHWAPNLVMVIQAAHNGATHNDGAIDYLNHVSDLIDQLTEMVGTSFGGTVDTGGGLDIRNIGLAFEAQRVPPLDENDDYDFWTSTWAIDAGQRV